MVVCVELGLGLGIVGRTAWICVVGFVVVGVVVGLGCACVLR